MARTAITSIATVNPNGATTQPAPQAIDQANGMVLAADPPSVYGVFPRPASAHNKLLIVANTFAGVKTITFRAGVNPPAFRSALGDMTLNMPASSTVYIPLPSLSQFSQGDGSINIDFAAGTTGTITVAAISPSVA